MPHRTISVIGGLVMDLVTVTERMPQWGETVHATSFTKHVGGKGANSAVAAYRASRTNPSAVGSRTCVGVDAEGHRTRTPSSSNDSEQEEEEEEEEEEGGGGGGGGRGRGRGSDIQVRIIGAVGNDEHGEPVMSKLQQSGVDVSSVRIIDGQMTSIAVIIVESEFGENRILFTAGASLSLVPDDFLTLESLGCGDGIKPDLLMTNLEIPRETVEQIIETAGREGVDVLLNPSPAHYLLQRAYKNITHLIVNETEAAMLSGQEPEDIATAAGWASATDYFLELGVKNVVLTLGAKGAYFSTAVGNGVCVPAEKGLDVVDVTGAGDTFNGTYAVEYVRQKRLGKWDIKLAVQRACKAAAHTICQLGAQEAIPWADEVDAVNEPPEALAAMTITQEVDGLEA